MENFDFVDNIEFTGDNYITVAINSNDRIDDYQFSVVNCSGNNLINCVKDRYEVNCLLYYIENFIPLRQSITKNIFSTEDFQKLIEQICDLALWTREQKLIMSNMILDIDYIFMDKYSNDVKLIYLPVMSNDNVTVATESFQNLIKKIVNLSTVNNADEFIGLVLSNINSKNFYIDNFKKKITGFKIKNEEASNFNSGIGGFVVYILVMAFFCIGIPLIGNIEKISMVTQYINYNGIIGFSVLFIFGALISLILWLIGNKRVKKIKRSKKVEQNYPRSYSSELRESQLPYKNLSEKKKINNNISKNTEYNPLRSEEFDLDSRKISKEDLKKVINKEVEGGTQLLINDDMDGQAYLIKKELSGINDRIYIDKNTFNVGRDKSKSDFAIIKSSISKQHATISCIGDRYYIIDNDSSNGTYLNSIRLQPNKSYDLNDRDDIIFADEHYQFLL